MPSGWSTAPGAFTGRLWKPPLDSTDRRFCAFRFASLTLSQAPTSQDVITLTLTFTLQPDTGRSASEVDTFAFGNVVSAASAAIPAAGQTVEPPFGSPQVATRARRLESDDGILSMAGGLVLAQWSDPGSDTQRFMPIGGFGRSIDWNDCAVRPAGGRWVPRPEERPRVDLIHYDGSTDAALWFEDAERAVGYAGTDRLVSVHNRSERTLTVGTRDAADLGRVLLVLRPQERCAVRVVLALNGDSEYVVEDAPHRYLVRAGAYFTVGAQLPYAWETGGWQFRFRPWLAASAVHRRDSDEFTFGSGASHASGDTLTDGLADSPHVVTVTHDGDLIFYEQVEAEVRGSGLLANGHSQVLVRQRAGTVTVLGRDWQPNLSGVGAHRTYTRPFVAECEAGDRYVSGILYPVATTTISFNNLRVNAFSQIYRVAPRIII